jgi:hypothetical protein
MWYVKIERHIHIKYLEGTGNVCSSPVHTKDEKNLQECHKLSQWCKLMVASILSKLYPPGFQTSQVHPTRSITAWRENKESCYHKNCPLQIGYYWTTHKKHLWSGEDKPSFCDNRTGEQ